MKDTYLFTPIYHLHEFTAEKDPLHNKILQKKNIPLAWKTQYIFPSTSRMIWAYIFHYSEPLHYNQHRSLSFSSYQFMVSKAKLLKDTFIFQCCIDDRKWSIYTINWRIIPNLLPSLLLAQYRKYHPWENDKICSFFE